MVWIWSVFFKIRSVLIIGETAFSLCVGIYLFVAVIGSLCGSLSVFSLYVSLFLGVYVSVLSL